jgi:endoglucanase
MFLKGIGIGNWLNPEGYMFGFGKTNCFRLMDTAFSELLN